jgi:protoporphyrinogen oxidase
VRGKLPEELKGIHWIYIPDRSIPFYRVGFYSNISPGTCAVGRHSLYVEVGVDGEHIDRAELINGIQPQVFKALSKLGWLDPDSVICTTTLVIRCAYAHLTSERDALLAEITGRLGERGIRLIGRYGQWDYMSMEDCIVSAIRGVDQLPS